jgi:lipoprotein-releasing system permease protein
VSPAVAGPARRVGRRGLGFETQVAIRHLRAGGGQTWLTISAVAAAVIIVIFVTGLIFGVQRKWVDLLTEAIPHVTVRVPDPKATPLAEIPGAPPGPSLSRLEQPAPQQKDIDDWLHVVEAVRTVPGVALINPVVRQQGFAGKGGHVIGVTVVGADPALQDRVTPVSKYMVQGRYQGLTSDEIVIDTELAADLALAVGDRIRLASNTGASDAFTIAGIYSRGQGRGDAYVTLRTAQSLFGLGTAVNVVFVKLEDIFRADEAADRIMTLVPYEAKSWSREFPLFLDRIRMQTATAYLISAFSLIASAFAIASVLIVSVLQKSKQIGILKAIGAQRRQILRIFVLEGLGIAVAGSAVGAWIGTSIVYLLGRIEQPPYRPGQPPEQFFPVAILPGYIGLAVAAAIGATVVAALLPARRAARLNPVDVMR